MGVSGNAWEWILVEEYEMTDKRIKMAMIAGAFILSLVFASAVVIGVDDTLEFVSGLVGIAQEVKE